MKKGITYSKIEDLNFDQDFSINENTNIWSNLYLKVAVIIIFSIIFLTTINLDVFHGNQSRVKAELNRVSTEPILADRGIIFDSNNTPLVINTPSYNLYIDSSYLQNNSLNDYLKSLSTILSVNPQLLIDNAHSNRNVYGNSVLISTNISKEQMLEVQNNNKLNNVFQIEPVSSRQYLYPNLFSLIIGYTGQVTGDDIKSNPSLTAQDVIGKDGLEYSYNTDLKGQDGQDIFEVDTSGDITGQLSKIVPVAGSNLILSISLPVQQELYDLLKQSLIDDNTATAAVGIVENVNTGAIIGMESLPTYNDNEFVKGISQADFDKLINDPSSPLMNRTIAEAQPPGSIMKTITAPAALQTGAITTNTIFNSNGIFEYDGVQFQDYAKEVWGNLNVLGGLKDSSNIFFFNTVINLGISNLVKYQELFGLGQKTGIDLPGEVDGTISDPATKQYLTGQVWYPGDSLNAAIGQGYTTVTPIQISNWISAIANGGTLYKPYIVSEIDNSDESITKKSSAQVIRSIPVSQDNLNVVKDGMRLAVTDGIDKSAGSTVVDVAGKTGTAEFGIKQTNGYTNAHAWFTGFAPYHNPQIAVTIFLESGGLSGNASKVASKFFTWYFGTYDTKKY